MVVEDEGMETFVATLKSSCEMHVFCISRVFVCLCRRVGMGGGDARQG